MKGGNSRSAQHTNPLPAVGSLALKITVRSLGRPSRCCRILLPDLESGNLLTSLHKLTSICLKRKLWTFGRHGQPTYRSAHDDSQIAETC